VTSRRISDVGRWPRVSHVLAVMAGVDAEERRPHLRCEHCGERFVTDPPMRVDMYVAICKEFIREHRSCRPGQAPTRRIAVAVTIGNGHPDGAVPA
jgi:transcription elongation factor Elf1